MINGFGSTKVYFLSCVIYEKSKIELKGINLPVLHVNPVC